LRGRIHRSKQAASGNPRAARPGVHSDLAQPGEINDQAALARAETCKAMPSAPDSGNNSALNACPDRVLYIAYVSAARDERWLAGYHAVPDGARIFIAAVGWTQQVAFESPA
jgi:hypothetical protein